MAIAISKRIGQIAMVLAFCLLGPSAAAHAMASGVSPVYIAEAQLVAVPAPSGDTVTLVQTIVFRNPSATAQPVMYALPQGASSPEILATQLGGWTLHGGMTLDNPHVPQGVTELVVAMKASLATQSASLTYAEPYDTRVLYVVSPEGSLALSAQGGFLTSSDTLQIKGVTYRRFTKLELAAGQSWTLGMTLLPTANGRQATPLPHLPILNAYSQSSVDLEAGANLLLAGAILVVGMLSIRSASYRGRPSLRRHTNPTRERLMEQWVDLEAKYAEGTVSEEEYQRQKMHYRTQVIALDYAGR